MFWKSFDPKFMKLSPFTKLSMTLFPNNFSAIFYLHLLIDVLYLKDVYAENDRQTTKEKNHK